jgi:hypothetical protein
MIARDFRVPGGKPMGITALLDLLKVLPSKKPDL